MVRNGRMHEIVGDGPNMKSTDRHILAARMGRIDSSEIRRVFQLAGKLENPINLSIGQPHFPTPAPIIQAMEKALRENRTAYTETQGILPLRERLSRKFHDQNGFTAHPEDILVSSGVSCLIQLLLLATIEPGDHVLLTDPCFLIYRSMLNFLGARITTIPEQFSLKDVEGLGGVLKLIIFCSPSNPSGHVMSAAQIRWLADLADQTGAVLVADEIYELFDYDGAFTSAGSIYPRTMTLMGFSKSYSMTGLRLAAATGPKDLITAMTTLQQYTVVCAPAPVQWAGIPALDLNMSSEVAAYRKNRNYVLERLRGRLNVGEPRGAFYIFPEIPGEDRAFVERAIMEKELLVVPGSVFTKKKNHIRVSYATDPDTLERGMDALLDLL